LWHEILFGTGNYEPDGSWRNRTFRLDDLVALVPNEFKPTGNYDELEGFVVLAERRNSAGEADSLIVFDEDPDGFLQAEDQVVRYLTGERLVSFLHAGDEMFRDELENGSITAERPMLVTDEDWQEVKQLMKARNRSE